MCRLVACECVVGVGEEQSWVLEGVAVWLTAEMAALLPTPGGSVGCVLVGGNILSRN